MTFTADDGAPLFYRESGAGAPVLVFVHGWQSTGVAWDPVVRLLAASHRCVVLDLRGTGASADAPGAYTVERFSADVADLLVHLRAGPAIVVGHSMGGAIAMRLAVDRPELLAGIVLVAPVPPTGMALPPKVEAVFRATAGDRVALERWMRRLTLEPLPDAEFSALLEAAAALRPDVVIETYESWSRLDFAREARTIAVPVLVLPGEFDRPNLTPEILAREIVQVVPGARMTVVERSGHNVPYEQPEFAAAAIDAFARRPEGGPA